MEPGAEKVPSPHSSQAVELKLSVSARPAGHVVHTATSSTLVQNSPGRHASQGVAGSWSLSLLPASQAVHRVPPQLVYVPFGHRKQGVAGSRSVSACPAAHSEHAVEALDANDPAEQASQLSTEKEPTEGPNFPAGQSSQ